MLVRKIFAFSSSVVSDYYFSKSIVDRVLLALYLDNCFFTVLGATLD